MRLFIKRSEYAIKDNMHVGMKNKPLILYDPLSYRSRLPIDSVVMPHKNKSSLDVGNAQL